MSLLFCGVDGGVGWVLLAWPLDEVHGLVIAGLSPLVCALFIEWQGRRLVWEAAMLGVLWMLVGAAASEGRVRLGRAGVVLPARVEFAGAGAALGLPVRHAAGLLRAGARGAGGPHPGVAVEHVFLIWVLGNLVAGFRTERSMTGACPVAARKPE